MAKLHLDLAVRSEIPNSFRLNASQVSEICGLNLGNLVFRHALLSMLGNARSYEPCDYPLFAQRVSECPPTKVIVSCANWLGVSERDEASNKFRADLIEPLDCPVICFGLGAQAGHDAERLSLGPESRRLARVLSSKAALISVRDQLTARTLNEIGVDNTCVTGCPSNFINTSMSLGAELAEKSARLEDQDPEWRDTRLMISEFSGGNTDSGRVLQEMINVLAAAPAHYVVQSPDLLPFIYKETSSLHGAYTTNTKLALRQLINVFNAKALAFTSVDAWLDFSRTCLFSFGMRIHGTMVPLQAGIPSLLITHDSRTLGLANELSIPALSTKEFLSNDLRRPLFLFESIKKQIKSYDMNRRRLAKHWGTFAGRNEITLTDGMYRLMGK